MNREQYDDLAATARILTHFITNVHPLTGREWTLNEFVKGWVLPMGKHGLCLCPLCKGEVDESN